MPKARSKGRFPKKTSYVRVPNKELDAKQLKFIHQAVNKAQAKQLTAIGLPSTSESNKGLYDILNIAISTGLWLVAHWLVIYSMPYDMLKVLAICFWSLLTGSIGSLVAMWISHYNAFSPTVYRTVRMIFGVLYPLVMAFFISWWLDKFSFTISIVVTAALKVAFYYMGLYYGTRAGVRFARSFTKSGDSLAKLGTRWAGT